jgi:hypothetical protein
MRGIGGAGLPREIWPRLFVGSLGSKARVGHIDRVTGEHLHRSFPLCTFAPSTRERLPPENSLKTPAHLAGESPFLPAIAIPSK